MTLIEQIFADKNGHESLAVKIRVNPQHPRYPRSIYLFITSQKRKT